MWRQEEKNETKQTLTPPGIRQQGMSQSSGICPSIHTKHIFLHPEAKQNPYCVLSFLMLALIASKHAIYLINKAAVYSYREENMF